jgi:hypothetical protein
MGTLLDLIVGLPPEAIPAASTDRLEAAPRTPAANDALDTPGPPQNTHAQNVARTEGEPATRRNAWTITRGGRPICTVCGAPMTRDAALAEARWRWPEADIE